MTINVIQHDGRLDIYDSLTMEHFFFIRDSIYLRVTEIIFTYSD
jgi:hypothetical protein